MKVELQVRVDTAENKSTKSFHYATLTAEGDVRAVLNFLTLVKGAFGLDHLK